MKRVCILGLGPSIIEFEKHNFDNIDDFILVNDHTRLAKNKKIVEKLKGKNIYIVSNISQEGFNPVVFDAFKIKKCFINRLLPNWDLWQRYKNLQIKNYQGGTVNNLGYLPILPEDEPYMHSWRGPRGRNKENMQTYDGQKIYHLPEEIEQFLKPTVEDKMICNCSYYASLCAIMCLKADQIIYYGIDFYNNLVIKKGWYHRPPLYNSKEWWDFRIKYEGEHMKVLFDKYLTKFFPNVKLEFFTSIKNCFTNDNIKCTTVETKKQRYY